MNSEQTESETMRDANEWNKGMAQKLSNGNNRIYIFMSFITSNLDKMHAACWMQYHTIASEFKYRKPFEYKFIYFFFFFLFAKCGPKAITTIAIFPSFCVSFNSKHQIQFHLPLATDHTLPSIDMTKSMNVK